MSAPVSAGPATSGPLRRGPMAGPAARAKNPGGSLRRLAAYLSGVRWQLGFAAGCVVGQAGLALLGPYLLGIALDRDIATHDVVGLAHTALLMLGAYVASNLVGLVSSWLMAGVSQRALQRLRGDLFGHLQKLPLSFFDSQAKGELMSRLTNDIDAINLAVAQNATALLASVLSMAGILLAMFALDARLALAAAIVVPLMFWFTRFVAVYTRRGFRQLQKDLGQLNGVMEETLAGQRDVLTFGRSEVAVQAFRAENERVYRAGLSANTYALLLMPLTTVLGNLFVIVLAGLGGWLALAGLVSVGTIASFINYGQNFVQPLRQISNLYNTLQAALAGAERVFEVLDVPPEIDVAASGRGEAVSRGAVRFEHVGFAYVPGVPVIEDLSLQAQPGQTIALVGPTGAGKTTVAALLTRFYEIDRGAISIDGVDIRSLSKAELRCALGLVLQDTYLFGTTVMENLRYGRLDASDQEVIAAARTAEADAFIRQLPQGYQTPLSERAGNLSHGQRQLLSIARTVLSNPSILILDEATSSIDTRTEVRLSRALSRLRQGRTSFVIAHRLSTIRDADQVLVIDAGRIVERGTHEQLLGRKGFYHRLYTSQFKGRAL